MTTESTIFLGPQCSAWGDDVSDPSTAATAQNFSPELLSGLNMRRMESIALDDTDTRAITIQGIADANKFVLYLSVVGECQVETVGKDTASAAINGYIPTYGTARFPGKILLSTYNLSSVTLRGLADSTTVEFGLFRMV